MIKEIELSKGKVTIINDSDFEKVSQFNWYCSYYGYAVRTVRVKGTSHRDMIWMHKFIMDCPNSMEVDHKNNNPLDNRRDNLRICTKKNNCKNKTKPKHNTSGYKGVSFDKKRKKYRAYIVLDNKQKFLGYYIDKNDAAIAYNNKAIEIFGEYSNLNKIEGKNDS